jgi:hypothetical protein
LEEPPSVPARIPTASMVVATTGVARIVVIASPWLLVLVAGETLCEWDLHNVFAKHLQTYLDEFAFRYNRSVTGRHGMFDASLSRMGKASPASSLRG